MSKISPLKKLVDEVQAMFVKAGLAVKVKYTPGDDAVDAQISLKGNWQGAGVGYAIQIAYYMGDSTPYCPNFYSGEGKNFGSLNLGQFRTMRAAAAAIIKHINANNTLAK